ncbi:hypothetical protein [uncultured Bacteroides sp.]|uniref:hypothetical protein n=1 Tax=uncultured Bacteroides sp. TaxID=162156 RepID=UPI002AAB3F65|nr:hypothetical protein [uncultured Bacteroides sp.]
MKNSRFSFLKRFPLLSFLLFVSFLCSCSNDDSDSGSVDKDALVAVHVRVGESWNDDEVVSSRSTSSAASSSVTVPLDKHWSMVATLSPVKDVHSRAATALSNGVHYRVIAYKENDVSASGYVNHADYVVGDAAPDFWLPVNKTYTFVCYSYGNSNALPAFDSSVTDLSVTPENDVLYYKTNVSITSASSSFSIAFDHVFSQVTVTATSSGSNITACSATLSPNYSATLPLSSGVATVSGTSSAKALSWSSSNGNSVSSNASTVFSNGEAVTLTFTSITIGSTTLIDKSITFTGKSMSANTKYTLSVNFRKSTGVIIGGLLWASANLIKIGSTYTFQPSHELYSGVWNGGDYWNWCTLDPTDYTNNYSGDYSASLDPCQQVVPAGTWRMPTLAEIDALKATGSVYATYNGVNGRYFGTTSVPVNADMDNYVFLPASGCRDLGTTTMSGVGSSGCYWSSTPYSSTGAYFLPFDSSNVYTYSYNRNFGFAIRCVSDL